MLQRGDRWTPEGANTTKMVLVCSGSHPITAHLHAFLHNLHTLFCIIQVLYIAILMKK